MATMREFSYPSGDGLHQIWATEWLPEHCAPRAVVQIVHGISEYVGRYAPYAEFLTGHGFAVVGDDHLGHGRTARPGEYGFIAESGGWDILAGDVHELRVLEGERFPDVPYFILGHSMGSFLTRTYLIRWPGSVDGAVLSGTGQEAPVTVAFGKGLAGLLCRTRGPRSVSKLITSLSLGAYNKQFKPNRTGSDWISRDEAQVDAYVADPLCSFVPTVGMFRDMMGGLQFIADPENLRRMDPDTPVYIYSGDKDPVGGSGAGVRKVHGFFQGAGVKDLTLKLYPGGRHEMHNELNRDEVFADTLAWLEGHMARSAAAGAERAAVE